MISSLTLTRESLDPQAQGSGIVESTSPQSFPRRRLSQNPPGTSFPRSAWECIANHRNRVCGWVLALPRRAWERGGL
ncbi:hypothetical protein, partial [Endozoicomonas sp.]|uniref:hypothetical protein n=1 Tax=Endozoicomonas sp. TaxID=1892382 RepID=UPI00383AADF1